MFQLAGADHAATEHRRDAHVHPGHFLEDGDRLDGRLERPRIVTRLVVPLGLPVVETDGHGEHSCRSKVAGQVGGEPDAGGEEFDRHIGGGVAGDVDDVPVEEGLAACEAKPADSRRPQIVDGLHDRGRVHPGARPLLVVAVVAVLRAGIGEAHLRMRRTGLAAHQMVRHEPRVGPAGKRWKVRVKNEVVAESPHRELLHVLGHEETGLRFHHEHLRVARQDSCKWKALPTGSPRHPGSRAVDRRRVHGRLLLFSTLHPSLSD